jgi:hypothetical protein
MQNTKKGVQKQGAAFTYLLTNKRFLGYLRENSDGGTSEFPQYPIGGWMSPRFGVAVLLAVPQALFIVGYASPNTPSPVDPAKEKLIHKSVRRHEQ